MNREQFRQSVIRDYKAAGDGFLTDKLTYIFKEIKTPEDMALHNYWSKEVSFLIGDNWTKGTADRPEYAKLLARIAHSILGWPAKTKGFLRKVANQIFFVAEMRKG
jgi:hypothetical protein